MSSLIKFKKIIKECVREVIKEELNTLNEIKTSQPQTLIKNKPIPKIQPKAPKPTGNVLQDILNETKYSMNKEDWNDSPMGESEIPEQSVPNYSELMGKINELDKNK